MVRISMLFIIVILFLSACNTISKKKSKDPFYFFSAAWNEDSVLPYQIWFSKDQHFKYTITHRDINLGIVKEHYSGTFIKVVDTIYLKYRHNKAPQQLQSFLIKEISGNYLIQNNLDNSRRVFLRKYRLNESRVY